MTAISPRHLSVLTYANLASRYRRTWAGFLWVVLSPILLYSAQAFVFHKILKIDVQNYPLFLALGLIPWVFLSQSLEMTVGLIYHQGRFLKSFPVHPFSLIGAQVIDCFINLIATLIIVVVPLLIFYDISPWRITYLFLALVPHIVATASLAVCLSTFQVFFVDIRFLLTFILQISFFLTPIFYPRTLLSDDLQWVVDYNIFHYLMKPFQIVHAGLEFSEFVLALVQSSLIACALAVIATLVWRSQRNGVYLKI